jgi:hypothetical protein
MKAYEETKAVRIAIKLIKTRMQAIAWDRNVFHKAGARYAQAVGAAKEWEQLEGALTVFESKLPARVGQAPETGWKERVTQGILSPPAGNVGAAAGQRSVRVVWSKNQPHASSLCHQ